VGEWPFRWRVLHEHRDRRADALIDEHHEYLVLVAKENCAAAAGRSQRANLNFDNGLTHTASLAIRLHAKIRIAVRIVAGPTTVSRMLEQPDVSPDLLLITSRPLHHKPAVSESRRALLQLVVETNSFGPATPLHFFQAGAHPTRPSSEDALIFYNFEPDAGRI
jgi:hypothetical protein